MSLSRGYSAVDRALHHVAFTLPGVQRTLADLETDLYRRQLATVVSRDEVFVTGVPRAGTTLVLELLYGTGEFASFTYRDMPFILSPLLWRRFSKSRQLQGKRAERAHGDGMEVSYDSPEAFEEVAWLALLGRHILRKDTLAPVPRQAMTPEAAEGLQTLVRKLLLAAAPEVGERQPLRYLSKNNANLSRLRVIEALFPSARVLVVYRNPLAQVASLAGQHERFLAEHASDAFSRRYMRWIGHFEFGANLRPIDFDGQYSRNGVPQDADTTFWLDYWTAAYRHALDKRGPRVHFVDFDALLAEPGPSLERLARIVGLRDAGRLVAAAATLRKPTVQPLVPENAPLPVLQAAQAVHRELQDAAAADGKPD
jgi:hypothetical protein